MIDKIKRMSVQDKAVVNNIIGAFAVKGFSLLLTLFTMPAYIRYFQDQTILGVWYTIISILNWVIYFDLGLGNGLRNLLPAALAENNKKRIREYISTTYITMTILVIAMSALGVMVIPKLNWNSFLNVADSVVDNQTLCGCVLIVYFGIMLQFVLKLVTSTLYALQKSAVVNFMTLCTSAITLLALYILPSSSLKANLWRMAFVNVIAAILPYIVVSILVYGKMLDKAYPTPKYFNLSFVSPILRIGVSLLWLQLVFMVISSTNEFLISRFTSPGYVVEYQAYYKVFKTGSMMFSLALTPIWSAVTKAQANKDYGWIVKIYKIFLVATLGCVILEFLVIPFLQRFMNLWLGNGVIQVNVFYAIVFVFSGSIFVLHNVNTSIGNGISYFRIQMIWMTFAAVIDIPMSYLCVHWMGSWIGVVIANVIALLPYEIIAPIYTMKEIKVLEKRGTIEYKSEKLQ